MLRPATACTISLIPLAAFFWAPGTAGAPGIAAGDSGSIPLVSIERLPTRGAIAMQDATCSLVQNGREPILQITTGHGVDWPGMTIKAPENAWDLSAYTDVAVHVKNIGSKPVDLHCRIDGPGGDGVKNSLTKSKSIRPGDWEILTVQLIRKLPEALAPKLFGMRGYPGGAQPKGMDPSEITQIILFVHKPEQDHIFQIRAIEARGAYDQGACLNICPEDFFPMIDPLGQFIHHDWPGKVQLENALRQDIGDELDELDEHPGPRDWDPYGGWQAGPQLEPRGFFYPVKRDGMWWLVDPEGRLFWSHGVDCVGFANGTTPIRDREFYFAGLPNQDSPLARFYGSGSWAPHGYYKDKGTYRTFNFTAANLMRKYGDAWTSQAADMAHRRLRSWSMNTIANWSDAGIYLQRKTPYVVSIHGDGAPRIEGSSGYWGKFPDPFDPSFRRALDRRMQAEIGKSAGDPWCIGYFVDNELAWGDDCSLASAALASPPGQAAKKVFLSDLKTKYDSIEKLNAVWKTSHASWEALAENQEAPDANNARLDLEAFTTRIAEEYFRHCRDAVKQVAPNNLYLGCRFAWVNDRVVHAAAKFCDVIGYNLYRVSVADFKLPGNLDRPVLIGEFHFGALDRGLFHTGLQPTASQQDRANAYRNYVTGALKNPYLIGTHWFQFGDQATTGRGDGENYQIGLVTICDRPYPETIAAVRDIGNRLYATRTDAGTIDPVSP